MIEVYTSFSELPLDAEPLFEGDDRIPLDKRRALVTARTLAGVGLQAKGYSMVVPYPSGLQESAHGDAVYGVKRIVHRATKTLPVLTAQTPRSKRTWGRFFTTKLRDVQRRHGLKETGWWDRATHEELGKWADGYAIDLLTPEGPTPAELQRRKVLSWLNAFYNARYSKDYSQLRPSQLGPVKSITRADCSGSVAGAMNSASVLPAVDWRWTNTDTQQHLGVPVMGLGAVRVGDVVLYGRNGDPSHEACVVSVAPDDVRVFSFGSYPAKILPIDYNRGSLGGRIMIRRFITEAAAPPV